MSIYTLYYTYYLQYTPVQLQYIIILLTRAADDMVYWEGSESIHNFHRVYIAVTKLQWRYRTARMAAYDDCIWTRRKIRTIIYLVFTRRCSARVSRQRCTYEYMYICDDGRLSRNEIDSISHYSVFLRFIFLCTGTLISNKVLRKNATISLPTSITLRAYTYVQYVYACWMFEWAR